jgi:hypothetical protein
MLTPLVILNDAAWTVPKLHTTGKERSKRDDFFTMRDSHELSYHTASASVLNLENYGTIYSRQTEHSA